MGVKDPAHIAAALDKALAKWEKLSVTINNDIEKFAAALQKEIYDKIDPAKM
jgi:hypothetical protein